MKKMDGKQDTPWEREEKEFCDPSIEATPKTDLRNAQGGATKTLTDYNNGTEKIKFIPIPHIKRKWTSKYQMQQKSRKRKENISSQ